MLALWDTYTAGDAKQRENVPYKLLIERQLDGTFTKTERQDMFDEAIQIVPHAGEP